MEGGNSSKSCGEELSSDLLLPTLFTSKKKRTPRAILLESMPAVIAMLRAVNLVSHNRIKMDALCSLCTSLKLRDPQTYVQSGNVVFGTNERNLAKVSKQISDGIEREFGFRTEVIVRSTAEMRDVVARNPFAKRRGIEPGKLLVLFFSGQPGLDARERIQSIKADRELRKDQNYVPEFVRFPMPTRRIRVELSEEEFKSLKVLQENGLGTTDAEALRAGFFTWYIQSYRHMPMRGRLR